MAQATHLLARVLRHLRDGTMDREFLDGERETLNRALRSLLNLTVAEEMSTDATAFCSPIALLGRYFQSPRYSLSHFNTNVVGSALLLLHSYSAIPSNSLDAPAKLSKQGYILAIDCNARAILPIARRIRNAWTSAPRHPSPFVLDWMYRCTVACNSIQKGKASVDENCMQEVREAMKLLSYQWPVGGMPFPISQYSRAKSNYSGRFIF